MSHLPTPDDILAAAEREFDRAYAALGDAGDWLRSDWRPGCSLTDAQARRRDAMRAAIVISKDAINAAKGVRS